MPQFQLPGRPGSRLSPFQIIILGFAGIILTGALLLITPLAAADGRAASFSDALFTSVSAVCVTGLVVCDTATRWSVFGQAVILVLIQIGGLGVVTAAASLVMLTGKNLSLKQRSTLQEAVSAPQMGGIAGFTKFILKVTFFTELAGALVMLPVFARDFGPRGVWMALFHSVSAFCNAGFDLLGRPGDLCPSLTAYTGSPVISLTVMLLIISGGIGFVTWEDFLHRKLNIRRYRVQSRIILSTTAFLILVPAVLFYFLEFSGLPVPERVLASLFQSVTARTAGFNTVPLNAMSGAGQAVLIALMMVMVPVYFLVSNVVAVPCAYMLLGGALVFFVLSPVPAVQGFCGDGLAFLSGALNGWLEWVSSWPFGVVNWQPGPVETAMCYGLAVVLWWHYRQPDWRKLALCIVLAGGWAVSGILSL